MDRTLIAWLLLVSTATGCAQAKDGPTVFTGGTAQTRGVTTGAPETGNDGGNVDLPRYPSISPDGSTIVFSWRGDLWKTSSIGGAAIRLTSHPQDDLRSAWSRDGTRIAFNSGRTGYANIHLMNADGTGVTQVTNVDRNCELTGFGVDAAGNEVVTFTASLEGDSFRAPRPYLCSITGGEIIRLNGAFATHARMSPDGTRTVLTRGGSRWSRRHYRGPDNRNVWLHTRADDSFRQLTTWTGNDGKACWLDADTLLFLSDRELDRFNIYRMDVTTGGDKAKRITAFGKDDVQDFDVSADGSTVVFTVWDRLYTLALGDPAAKPIALSITANEDEADNFQIKAIDKEVSEAALSPDGKVMAFVAYGRVYVRNLDEKSPTRRVAEPSTSTKPPHARERQIAWSPTGLKLYFVSDRSGSDSIYVATVALTRGEVKEEFKKATEPPEDKEEEPIEETDEPGNKQSSEEGVPPEQTEAESQTPDPSKHNDAKDDDEEDDEDDKESKEDEEELPKELQAKRWHDALTFHIEPVVEADTNDRQPSPSPDGKSLAFKRSRGDLMILDLKSGETRNLVSGWDTDLDWRWSPDSRHIAYQQHDLNFNSDIWVVPADASEPAVNVTRHPDDDFNPRWSADGKILSFISERVNEEFDLWMVFLDADLEAMTPREFEDYYKDAVEAVKERKPLKVEKPKSEKEEGEDGADKNDEPNVDQSKNAAKKKADADEKEKDEKKEEDEKEEPKELDLQDAYLRVRRVTELGGDEGENEITPGGDYYIFTATIGEKGLYSVKWNGEDRKRLCDDASVQHVSLTGDKIVLVIKGRAGTIGPEGDKIEYVDLSDSIRVDLQEQASQKFLEMARLIGENFYHPTLKGLDWGALSRKYHALARQTRTANEFDYVGMRLFGELNGSHLGVYSRGDKSPNIQPQGRLGTVHKRVDDSYEVVEVVPKTPAAKGPMALKLGDLITAIELEPFAPTDTIESRLTGRVDRETIITIRRTLDDGEVKELNVLMTPIGRGEFFNLKYRAWRRSNADLVAQWSNGKIGYIHIRAMGQAALDVFERDLFAAAGDKEGLIIDVRNNGGGWTADRLLASIMVQPHAYTIPRGGSPSDIGHYPQSRLFIQRYTLPINMLCNQKSFSNAEIVSHAFKTLKRGKLVGQKTYGGVISTGGTRLIDGTWVRLPFRGWYVMGGVDMENNGAIPDIIVRQTPEAESRNEDEQLRAAVDDLMKRLK